ncbi:MAG TPA: benzoyl-CoA-dihydrodiol lyase, partial [Casimicrobiaceae bacterium]|nr:benzoyl-CoA-dihydrodiol lyase [Casimicrobiaceae bacterium]
TLVEGVRAQRAKEWRLIDGHAKPQQFASAVRERAQALAAQSDRPADAKGVALTPLARTVDAAGYHYEHVDVRIDRSARSATISVRAPASPPPQELDAILAQGVAWWPLAMARELDDAILLLRTNELTLGTWVLKTEGDLANALAADAALEQHAANWFVRETIGMLRRTLARLDVTSRTLFALIEKGSCFGGTLLELALAADRQYMIALPDDAARPRIALSTMNFGSYPAVNGRSRIAARFYDEEEPMAAVRAASGAKLDAAAAMALGLVTSAPDDLDWDDEVRIAIEERASLSPDALTGMEANLRFGPAETMETRVFGRLSAWQNWIFNRPNAVGEQGALKVFGTGHKAKFNWDRT